MAISSIGGSAPTAQATGKSGQKEDVVQSFLEYMNKTPAERMEDAWLRQHGLTREQLAALPPEERKKIIDEMKEDIKRQVEESVENALHRKTVLWNAG